MYSYFICAKATLHSNVSLFKDHVSHYMELPNGEVVMACEFRDSGAEDLWNSRAVSPLPHPHFERDAKLSHDHVGKLKHFGVQHGDTIVEVCNKLGRVNHAFRVHRYRG